MNFSNKIKIANVFYDRSFQKYWLARFLSSLCLGTLSVCIAWQIYDISRNPLHLGLIGLTQFVPLILLVVVTGYFADNFNRKKIFYISLLGEGLLTFLFFVINFINYANIPQRSINCFQFYFSLFYIHYYVYVLLLLLYNLQ